jgi:tRNA threonylcarbamoyladenosine biosynthesis protein TsaB
MAVTLVLDTAFDTCQVGLWRDGACIDTRRDAAGGAHDRVLAGFVADILNKNNIMPAQINRIFVTTGPGRFTGLRLGIAYARGFALVHKIPVIPVSCMDAIDRDLAAANKSAPVRAVLIAVKRGEIFVRITHTKTGDITAVPNDNIADYLTGYAPLVAGGVLSPEFYALGPIAGVVVDARVTEPSLESIYAIADAAPQNAGAVVRPYYAA